MEREKELVKLINVLRRTSRMALQSEWTGGKEDAAAFCTEQYNRVLARLKEMDPGVGVIFEPLPAGSSLTVVAMASRQLGAYYEDELGPAKGFGRGAYGFAFDSNKSLKTWASSFARVSMNGCDTRRRRAARRKVQLKAVNDYSYQAGAARSVVLDRIFTINRIIL